MARLDRLYAIQEELRRSAGVPVSAAALAERFEVSRRTIERDLDTLRRAGVPLYTEAGRRGGAVLHQRTDARLLFSLDAEEVTALLLAASAVGSLPFGAAGQQAMARLLEALPTPTRLEVERLRGRIRAVPADGPAVRAPVRRALQDAVRQRRVVNLRYVDRNGQATARAVEAHGFYGSGDGWYLIGWCRLRDAGRIFRLDRVRSARLTAEVAPDRDVDEVLGWVPQAVAAPGQTSTYR
ncbi:MAG: helix-turn-helix transcriptional regulator [Acidimicrobiia bacterium]